MYMFFDTETTGLPNFNLGLTDAAQPRILQIAMLLRDADGRDIAAWKAPIKPEGWRVDERKVNDQGKPTAYAIHGIGNAYLEQYGVGIKQALGMFRWFESKATLKVAHNYRFDGFLLKSEHERAGVAPIDPPIDKFCTMKVMTDLMKLPPTANMVAAGFDKPKSAKLSEAYKYCTGRELIGAHDAFADVKACADVFFWIKENGHFEHQPRVTAEQAAARRAAAQ